MATHTKKPCFLPEQCLRRYLLDPAYTDRLQVLAGYKQHGDTSCLAHSIAVAYYSLVLAARLPFRFDPDRLAVGALLHDYFLYDWHDRAAAPRLHGFRHPGIAAANACRDFSLGAAEQDIIRRHMFPLTPIPPRYREGLIVCLIDKWCSLREVLESTPHAALLARLWPAKAPLPKVSRSSCKDVKK